MKKRTTEELIRDHEARLDRLKERRRHGALTAALKNNGVSSALKSQVAEVKRDMSAISHAILMTGPSGPYKDSSLHQALVALRSAIDSRADDAARAVQEEIG